MIYLLSAFIIVALFFGYIYLSKKFNIYSIPVKRSSHSTQTLTGGGVVFFLIISFCLFCYSKNPYPLFIGLSLCAVISFLDDIFDVRARYRLIIQFLSSGFLVFSIVPDNFNLLLIFIIIFFSVCWMNAFNFMDGINGIAGIYGLVSLTSFYFLNESLDFVDQSLIIYLIIGVLAFGYFNFRSIAILFMGDVGSISISFILSYIMINLIIHTGQISFIIMFSVFGIDSFFTIIERIIKKENITIAHRSHLFQLLSNELKFKHLLVSSCYGLIQLSINYLLILTYSNEVYFQYFSIAILLILCITYVQIKRYIKLKIKQNKE